MTDGRCHNPIAVHGVERVRQDQQPPAGARANASIAMSISAGLRTPDAIASTPSEGAAVAIDCR
jgi:hypothetical protein